MSRWDVAVFVEWRSKRGWPKTRSFTFDMRWPMAALVAAGFAFGIH